MSATSSRQAPALPPDRPLELAGAAQQGIGVFDETDRLVYANGFYRQLLCLEEDTWPTWQEILRANHRDQSGNRIATADFEAWIASAASRRGKQPFRAFEADSTATAGCTSPRPRWPTAGCCASSPTSPSWAPTSAPCASSATWPCAPR